MLSKKGKGPRTGPIRLVLSLTYTGVRRLRALACLKHGSSDQFCLHFFAPSYHSAATLSTMKAYRIGRKPAGLWINKTPPIRGGIFRNLDNVPTTSAVFLEGPTHTADDVPGDSSSEAMSDRNSPTPPTSRSASVDGLEKLKDDFSGLEDVVRRRGPAAANVVHATSDGPGQQYAVSPAEYMDWAVQQGIDKGIQDYPSLDLDVQQDIVGKYRELHQKVIEEGLYDCPYKEYAKEMARYSCLFAGALVALHHEWYVTSAVLLGLFWVCFSLPSSMRLPGAHLITPAPNHVHGA